MTPLFCMVIMCLLLLLQLGFPEIEHLGEDVVACVATIDAVVAVGVVVHVELLVGLYQCLRILHAIAHVYVVVGHTMHKEQVSIKICSSADG